MIRRACDRSVAMLCLLGSAWCASNAAAEDAKQPDLDVLFIKRLPSYTPGPWIYPASGAQYMGDPATGRPFTAEELRTTHKQWPDAGEKVEFLAVVANKSDAASGRFDYVWSLDGQKAGSGAIERLEPWGRTELRLTWAWDTRRHTVRLQVDPENKIAEPCEANNALEDFTDALSLQMRITPQLYKAFDGKPNKLGSRSFEDWIQRHVKLMNGVFAGCRYPGLTPDGIAERVRIQEIVQMTKEEMKKIPQTFGCDGGWNFYDDNFPAWFKFHIEDDFVAKVDTGLLHELTHQLGIIDIYCIVVAGHWNHVRDEEGGHYFLGYHARQPDMMGGAGPFVDNDGNVVECFTFTPRPDGSVDVGFGKTFAAYSPQTAGALHRMAGLRRGHFGLYLFDLPKASALRILDNAGKPAKDISVRIYQQSPHPGPQSIPDIPTMRGHTSAEGITPLGSVPFGNISPIGINGVLFLVIEGRGHRECRFLDISTFNLAAWMGYKDYWLASLRTGVPPEGAPQAPKGLRWGLLKHGAKPLLQWDPVPGAAGYNVCRQRTYGKQEGPTNLSVTFDTPYVKVETLPADKTSVEITPIPGYAGASEQPHFTVTAVDADGRESAHARNKELTRWGPWPVPNVVIERKDAQTVKVTLGRGTGAIQARSSFVVERGSTFRVRAKTLSEGASAFRLNVAGLGEVQIPLTGAAAPGVPALTQASLKADDQWHEVALDLRAALDKLAQEKKVAPAQARTTWNDDWLVTSCTFGNWGDASKEQQVYDLEGPQITRR
ncbi:MAG: hypothetical protein FJ291_15810 [Planctomycetes bacterium]|nr:hypothetical protein [Planctomycetota bacterium]